MSELILITGEIGSGKTSLCRELVKIARQKDVDLAGLISPGVFNNQDKIAIDVHDLRSGKQKRLAELNKNQNQGLRTKRWAFDPEAVAWGNQILAEAAPCDLLLIDEIGPLELNRDQGWVNALQTLKAGKYQCAVVVIRPSLLTQARELWPAAKVVDLDQAPVQPQELYDSLGLESTA